MRETKPEPWFGLLERLGDAVTVIDSTWHYRFLSAGAAAAIGRSAEELVGAYVWDVFPEVVGSPEQQAALRAMETGEPEDIVWFFDRLGRWFEQRAVPTPAGMIVIVNDVTDRELTRQRAERLVEVGEALARTMNYEQVQAVVARDVLPLVGASGGSLAVIDRGRGLLRFLGWSGLDPKVVAGWQEIPLHMSTPSTEAIRSGRPVWEPDPVAAAKRFPDLADQLAAIPDGVVAMPLVAGGETIGTLTMTFPDLMAVGGPDRAFLSTAAAMCGQALNRAHLFAAGKRTLDELQRHLLPRELPRVAGLELAVRYLSAETGVAIGGDWYDVVALPSGAVALVMGDVEGHDLAAAALMGLVRSALRAYLAEEHPPAVAVARTNTFLHGLGVERLATVAVLQLHARERLVIAVSAGHPIALVGSPEGGVFDIPTEVGPPLGVQREGMHWVESTSTLPDGAALLLYTDGLVEERDASITDGIDRIRTVLRSGARLPAEQLLELLLSVRTTGFADDVALLVCRLVPAARPEGGRLTRRLPASPVSATLSRRFSRQLLAGWRVSASVAADVELVVSELVTNAARASEEPIELCLSRPGSVLRVEVGDTSHQQPRLDPDAVPDRTEGRGLHLVEALVSRWGVESDVHGKTVWAEFDLRERSDGVDPGTG